MNKIKSSLSDFKIEFFILLISIAFFIVGVIVGVIIYNNSFVDIKITLDNLAVKIFPNDRLNMIATILTITTGFYLTIATVVSVSVINVSRAILESQSDKPIITLIMLGIIENIVCIILCTWLIGDDEIKNIFVSFWLSIVILMSLVTFAKFINFVRHLLIENMKQMQKDFQVEDEKENELFSLLENIEKNTRVK
jgi:hypothetical protein|nr:MAG: hypothetical protein [Bacteriophage sp.]